MESLPRPVLVFIAMITTVGWAANLVSGLLGGPTDGAVNAIYATLVGSGLVAGGVKAWRGSAAAADGNSVPTSGRGGDDDRPRRRNPRDDRDDRDDDEEWDQGWDEPPPRSPTRHRR